MTKWRRHRDAGMDNARRHVETTSGTKIWNAPVRSDVLKAQVLKDKTLKVQEHWHRRRDTPSLQRAPLTCRSFGQAWVQALVLASRAHAWLQNPSWRLACASSAAFQGPAPKARRQPSRRAPGWRSDRHPRSPSSSSPSSPSSAGLRRWQQRHWWWFPATPASSPSAWQPARH